MKKLKIALIHDFFIMYGGAERLFEALLKFPYDFKIYTSISYRKDYNGLPIHTSFMQKLPFLKQLLEFYKNLLPFAFEQLQFPDDVDLVLSDTASFAKFIIPPPGVKHISYIHTPPRFLWNLDASLKVRRNFLLQFLYNLFLGNSQRIADFNHAQRVHVLIANSKETQGRIKKFYKRDSVVINPPVEVLEIAKASKSIPKNDSYLFFNRIEAYKNIEQLLKIWPRDRKLTVAGTGSLLSTLQKQYAEYKNITFTGFVPEKDKIKLLTSHKALIYPNREDFGIIMAEALAAGTPVIAPNVGGSTEIVTHKKTGWLFERMTKEELENALNWVDSQPDNDSFRTQLSQSVIQFDTSKFMDKMTRIIEETVQENE